jgi:hypothetical protein
VKITTKGTCAAIGAAAVLGSFTAVAAPGTPLTVAEPSGPVQPTDTVQTTQVAPSQPDVAKAVPEITGPAPLPPEDQGARGS